MSLNSSKTTISILQKGLSYKAKRQYQDAIHCFQTILSSNSNHIDAMNNLGAVYKEMGERSLACDFFFKVLALKPDYLTAHANLALIFLETKEYKRSYAHFQKAYPAFKENANFLFHFGLNGKKLNNIKEATEQYEKAIQIDTNYYPAINNLSILKILMGELCEAEKLLLDAIKRFPNKYKLLLNLGLCYEEQGEIQKAIAYYKKAINIEKNGKQARSNLLFAMHYIEDIDAQQLYECHSKYFSMREPVSFKNDGISTFKTQQTINIGYLSPDFRHHPVASFMYPILLNHNKNQFNIFCYSNNNSNDDMTVTLKKLSTKWIDISSMDDKEVCQLIQNDCIHILVDLAGHSKNNRIGIFEMKPAPVQVSYLGYPGTTGLSQIDYRLTDIWADPVELEPFYKEKLIRLPHSFLCFDPEYQFPEINHLPALKNNSITLGSFNRMSKLNSYVFTLWASILIRLPNSKIVLKAQAFHDPVIRKRVQSFFEKKGVSTDRLTLLERTNSRIDHLQLYHKIDIALDTFPYHGTATTCQALWMGVPVITLQGHSHVSRVSGSILNALGLRDFIAFSPETYIEKVIHLSNNIHLLSQIRNNLRYIIKRSPLNQSKTFTKHLEKSFEKMMLHYLHS